MSVVTTLWILGWWRGREKTSHLPLDDGIFLLGHIYFNFVEVDGKDCVKVKLLFLIAMYWEVNCNLEFTTSSYWHLFLIAIMSRLYFRWKGDWGWAISWMRNTLWKLIITIEFGAQEMWIGPNWMLLVQDFIGYKELTTPGVAVIQTVVLNSLKNVRNATIMFAVTIFHILENAYIINISQCSICKCDDCNLRKNTEYFR